VIALFVIPIISLLYGFFSLTRMDTSHHETKSFSFSYTLKRNVLLTMVKENIDDGTFLRLACVLHSTGLYSNVCKCNALKLYPARPEKMVGVNAVT
jgi:hypothetical protein